MRLTYIFVLLILLNVPNKSQIVKTITPDEGKITALTFSNGGDYLAFGTTAGVLSDKSIFLFSTNDWKKFSEFGGMGRDVQSIKFSPDDKYIATTHAAAGIKITGGTGDQTVLVWDINGHLKFNPDYKIYVGGLEFSNDSKHIILNHLKEVTRFTRGAHKYSWDGYSTLIYINIENGEKEEHDINKYHFEDAWETKEDEIDEHFYFLELKVTNNGKFILCDAFIRQEDNGTVFLYDIENNKSSTLQTKNKLHWCVMDISPDGSLAAVANYSDDDWIYLWDLNSKLSVKTLKGHEKVVKCVAFSPDGKYLASSSKDETIKLWDVKTGKLIQTLKGHQSDVNAVTFSPDGKYLVSGSDDESIIIWDAGALLPELKIYSTQYDLTIGLKKQLEKEKADEIAALNDLFKPKGEFETTEEYNSRIKDANEKKATIEEKYKQKLEEAINSKQTELQSLNEEKKQNDQKKSDEIQQQIEKSIRDTIVNIAEVGTYNADANKLPVTVKGKSGFITILRSEAQSLKENWKTTQAKAKMKLREDLKSYEYFDIIIIHPTTKNEFKLEY